MSVYKLSSNAVLECFEDGGLVLLVPERRLVELNPTAMDIVNLFDGQRTLEQVAIELAKYYDIGQDINHDIPPDHVLQDVLELSNELYQNGILELLMNGRGE
jgi:hypothetical protein